jgi:PKHD-type hydroxylase|tara:strand:- start:574 stop:1152 length:579 start_codon:yes stop_codon:yes gene_type:complete
LKDKPKSFSWSFELDKVNLFAYTNNFLSDQECKDIIDIGKSKQLEKGSTGNNNINKTRKSNVSWICPDDNFQLYRKLTDTITNLNKQFFGFDLYGLTEGLQFTNYKAPDGKYDSHVDRSYGTQIRKLSIVILLSDDFEGGDFELISGDKPDKLKMEKGKLFLFPSFVLHRVKPITKGERNSLVAWVTGPNFK